VLQNSTAEAPRRRRVNEPKRRLKTIAMLDQRTHAARRIASLVRAWTAQIGHKLTDVQRIEVERAAGLTALAEDAKARRLAGDTSISLWDTVRLDNSAARAVAALGLPVAGERRRKTGFELGSLKW
jgi:hypothetical protein